MLLRAPAAIAPIRRVEAVASVFAVGKDSAVVAILKNHAV
jgi:hypothetical protein